MRWNCLVLAAAMALVTEACYHGYEIRHYKLEAADNDYRLSLIDDSRRLLIETATCSIAITPAYIGTIIVWIEQDPLRPCSELILRELAFSGKRLPNPAKYFIYGGTPSQERLPFTVSRDTVVQIEVEVGLWSKVPEAERLFEAHIGIEVDGEPVRVAFRTVAMASKELMAKPYWRHQAR